MSKLYYQLRNEPSYKEYGQSIDKQYSKSTDDKGLLSDRYSTKSKNVPDHFNKAFLVGFVSFHHGQREVDSLSAARHQVFIGIFGMEYGLEINKIIMKALQTALSLAELPENERSLIDVAFKEYEKQGKLTQAKPSDRGKASVTLLLATTDMSHYKMIW